MSIFTLKPLAKKVTFDRNNMCVELTDGRKLTVPLAFFPRLLDSTPRQRSQYVISGGGVGLHWDELDEDISVEALFQGHVADRKAALSISKENSTHSRRLKAA